MNGVNSSEGLHVSVGRVEGVNVRGLMCGRGQMTDDGKVWMIGN